MKNAILIILVAIPLNLYSFFNIDHEMKFISPLYDCVLLNTYAYDFDQSDIRMDFINWCSFPVYTKVCVTDNKGNSKLYKSRFKIPSNGVFKFTNHYFFANYIADVAWISDVEVPESPKPCL